MEIQLSPNEPQNGKYQLIAYFDNTSSINFNAILSVIRTIFVCIVLASASLIFSKDATDLVLTPIENMLRKINNITENPMKARKIEEEEAFLWEKMFKDNQSVAK